MKLNESGSSCLAVLFVAGSEECGCSGWAGTLAPWEFAFHGHLKLQMVGDSLGPAVGGFTVRNCFL